MKKQRFCIILILCVCLFSILINASAAGSIQDFINDSRWANGVSWGDGQTPKTDPTAQWWGCAAYCYDYVNYCYGYTNPRAGEAFYSVNEIRAGDVITVGNQSDGNGHWMVVVQRSGNSLYVAEGNFNGAVRIGWNYTISGSKFAEDDRNFTAGYHFLGESDPIIVSKDTTGYASIPDGVYELAPACAPGSRLDIYGGSTEVGAITHIWQQADVESQKFIITNVGGAYYKISPKHSGLVLDVYGAYVYSGTKVYQYTWADVENQKWVFFSAGNGYYYIRPSHNTNLGLGVSGACSDNGTNVLVYGKNTTDAQKWKLEPIDVPVTSVSLNRTSLQMTTGEAFNLSASVSPSTATNRTVTWTSSAPGVATVSSTGRVRAVSPGTATITATTENGGKIARCYVTVASAACTVSFNANGGNGSMADLSGNINTNVRLTTNTFTRSGYDFAGWNTKANGNGTSYADGASVTLTGDLTLYAQWRTALSIRYASKTVNVGDTFQFNATGGSAGYTWRTGNTSIATVSTGGKVTGKAVGNTYLYCKDSYGTEVKCLLKVTAAPLSIRYEEKTVTVGRSFQFTATGGTGGNTWRVGNTATVTVDSTGKVTGKAAGITWLYCKDSSGTEVKCLLKVVELPSIRYAEKTVKVGVPFQFTATGGTGGYTWRVGNTATATVDTTGKVTGKAVGNTYLYCKDSSGAEVKCLLKVIAPLSIRYGEKIVMIGTPFQFEATGGSGSYTWRTGNTATATVSTSGEVTGKTAGNTYLYCKDSAGAEVKCLLKIIAPVSIRYSDKTVNVGSTFQFEATGGSGSYTWRTGNTSVATVDAAGKVTGKTAGNTYLYCRDSYGNEVKCLLKIK